MKKGHFFVLMFAVSVAAIGEEVKPIIKFYDELIAIYSEDGDYLKDVKVMELGAPEDIVVYDRDDSGLMKIMFDGKGVYIDEAAVELDDAFDSVKISASCSSVNVVKKEDRVIATSMGVGECE